MSTIPSPKFKKGDKVTRLNHIDVFEVASGSYIAAANDYLYHITLNSALFTAFEAELTLYVPAIQPSPKFKIGDQVLRFNQPGVLTVDSLMFDTTLCVWDYIVRQDNGSKYRVIEHFLTLHNPNAVRPGSCPVVNVANHQHLCFKIGDKVVYNTEVYEVTDAYFSGNGDLYYDLAGKTATIPGVSAASLTPRPPITYEQLASWGSSDVKGPVCTCGAKFTTWVDDHMHFCDLYKGDV